MPGTLVDHNDAAIAQLLISLAQSMGTAVSPKGLKLRRSVRS